MNYDYIENLVTEAKTGDLRSKELLIDEFTPFINSLSIKTFIHGYEKCDIKNECFLTLFTCISRYNSGAHRFVAYATNAIKNNISTLLIKADNQNGVDKAGDPTFSKKTFSNVRTGANVEDIYAVAEAVKGVLSASTRSYLLNESSTIAQV